MLGSGETSTMVLTSVPPETLNTMVSISALVFALIIASRRVPLPLSLVLLTVNVAPGSKMLVQSRRAATAARIEISDFNFIFQGSRLKRGAAPYHTSLLLLQAIELIAYRRGHIGH